MDGNAGGVPSGSRASARIFSIHGSDVLNHARTRRCVAGSLITRLHFSYLAGNDAQSNVSASSIHSTGNPSHMDSHDDFAS